MEPGFFSAHNSYKWICAGGVLEESASYPQSMYLVDPVEPISLFLN